MLGVHLRRQVLQRVREQDRVGCSASLTPVVRAVAMTSDVASFPLYVPPQVKKMSTRVPDARSLGHRLFRYPYLLRYFPHFDHSTHHFHPNYKQVCIHSVPRLLLNELLVCSTIAREQKSLIRFERETNERKAQPRCQLQ